MQVQRGMDENTSKTEARTTIDTMLELIRSKGRIDLNSIAVSLGIASSVVEGWAKVLESGNLIKISYEVGKMYMSPMEFSKEEMQALESKTEQQKYILSEEIEADVISVEKLAQSLKDINSSLGTFDERLFKQSPNAKKKVNELSKLYSQMRSYQSNLESVNKRINSEYDAIDKKFKGVMDKLTKVSTQEEKTKAAIPTTIQQNLDSAKSALQELDVVRKNVNDTIENTRRDLENQLKQENARLNEMMHQAHEQLEKAYADLQKESGTFKGDIKELKDFQLEEEQLSKKLSQEHAEFNSNYSKLEQSLKETTAKFMPKYEEAMSEINKVMEGAGSIGDVIKNLSDLKSEVKDLEPRLNEYKQDLQKLKDQVDALQTAKNLSASEKVAKLSNIEEKRKIVNSKVKMHNKKIIGSLNSINGILNKGKKKPEADNADKKS